MMFLCPAWICSDLPARISQDELSAFAVSQIPRKWPGQLSAEATNKPTIGMDEPYPALATFYIPSSLAMTMFADFVVGTAAL